MADDSSLRKPVGGDGDGDDRPGDRKRKDPNDGDDYFQVENGDDGEIKVSNKSKTLTLKSHYLTIKPEEKGRSDNCKVMADDSSLRKPIGGDGDGDDMPSNRKRKDPNDGDDYFQVENGDDGEIKGNHSSDHLP
ncbi:hypothetical protein R6Q59_024514 [Mikania micrantha]